MNTIDNDDIVEYYLPYLDYAKYYYKLNRGNLIMLYDHKLTSIDSSIDLEYIIIIEE